jgi:hypothetical protein
MKTKITTLLFLILGLSSGKTQAQDTYHHYTDAEGLTWTFLIDGSGSAIISRTPSEKHCVTGPSFTTSSWNGYFGGPYISYTGDELRIPASVSDGTNTYPVTEIAELAFDHGFIAKKVVIPSTVRRIHEEAFFHTSIQRIEALPGCQVSELERLSFASSAFDIGDYRNTVYYYDFSECPLVPVSGSEDDAFFETNDNTLLFTNAASNQTLGYHRAKSSTFTNTDNVVRAGICATLHIDDEESFESPRTFTATQASYNRVFSNTAGKAVSTLYLPYPTDLPSGMRAYTLTCKGFDETGTKAFMFAPIPDNTRLEAYKPYLVQVTDGQNHTLPIMHNVTVSATPDIESTAIDASEDNNWRFYGTTKYIGNTTAFAKKAYYLDGNKWWQVQSGVANDFIRPFRCFISSPTGVAAAPSFFMVLEGDNTADGIKALETETNTDIKSGKYPFYSVDGKQMGNDYNKLESGQMYIVNGKKFYKI